MKKIYLETTIPSYLVAKPSRDIVLLSHQELTKEWWENHRKDFKLFISQIVINEIRAGDKILSSKRLKLVKGIPSLEINKEIEDLAMKYFKYFNFPERAIRDAFHIAFSVFHKIDFLLTWNCAHLANPYTRSELADYNNKIGYRTPDICTPEELMGGI